jgi:hypothetical protein
MCTYIAIALNHKLYYSHFVIANTFMSLNPRHYEKIIYVATGLFSYNLILLNIFFIATDTFFS